PSFFAAEPSTPTSAFTEAPFSIFSDPSPFAATVNPPVFGLDAVKDDPTPVTVTDPFPPLAPILTLGAVTAPLSLTIRVPVPFPPTWRAPRRTFSADLSLVTAKVPLPFAC